MQRDSASNQKGREKKILTRESGDRLSSGGRPQRRGDERVQGNADSRAPGRSVAIEGILTRSK